MESEGLPLGLIVGIVLGFSSVLLGTIVIFGLLYYLKRKVTDEENVAVEESGRNQEHQERGITSLASLRLNSQDSSIELSDCHDDDDEGSNSPAVSDPRPADASRGIFALFKRSSSSGLKDNSKTRKFTYKELQKATNGFTKLVGGGGSSSVFKGVLPSGQIVAIKMINDMDNSNKEFQTEVMLLERLHHRNLVNLVGYCMDKGRKCYLVYEYMTNGSLSDILHDKNRNPLSWEQRVSIAQDTARGIEYLHKGATPPIIHRDIKCANVLLDESMTARVSDFGLSKESFPGRAPSGVRGTFGYVDPLYVKSKILTDKSDIYSFGVFLFELICGFSPQQGLLDYVKQTSTEGTPWLDLLDRRLQGRCNKDDFEAMISLALQCLSEDPSQRPSIRKINVSLSALGQLGHKHQRTISE